MDVAPDLNIIDRMMAAYAALIDSGFGLLGPKVRNLSSILIALDVTLAALWWTLEGDDNILGRLIKKVLYVGAFVFILNNFASLSGIIFRSFADLGVTAGGGGISTADLLRPGKLAGVGFTAAHPLIDKASDLMGFPEFFANALTIFILLLAWVLVVLAFFVMSIQMLVTVLEFKLTSLAGFALVPFAFWNKSSFLAERVLGNVISSGVKVMVLAVIVGIGNTFFDTFLSTLGPDPDLSAAMTLLLSALTLAGLSIFGPGIAAGLVSGAPQLGAGAAVGAAAGAAMLGGGAAMLGAKAAGIAGAGGLAAVRAGAALGSGASAAYQLRQATSGASGLQGVAAGLGGVGRAMGGAAMAGMRDVFGRAGDALQSSAQSGRAAAWRATGGASPVSGGPSPGGASGASDMPPPWARDLHVNRSPSLGHHAAIQTLKDGDRPGAPANPDLSQED
ncbi:P-type conjugative transfer protein TrbL [Caulobacter sp. Root487D2Y]|uniref:P-type conjugative transfer protein TrbL n=1 Tax=Caulobacter sp. Root487D2Y TaxID=1736547 RepID=UPI0009EA1141|nr:P-type conjugative transfer protein TrbL [Caulobacter sp. Root487D2Y]